MKKITRMLIFSALALYLTSLWNHGFKVNFEPYIFVRTVLLVSLFYYLIIPVTRFVLLPVNLLTLGLVSSVVYFLLFYFFITRFSLVEIKSWVFPGLNFYGFTVKSTPINMIVNILLSAISLSFIVNFLEGIL